MSSETRGGEAVSPSQPPTAVPLGKRRVLFYDPHGIDDEVSRNLLEEGWEVSKARELDQVRTLLYERRYEVGLFVLGQKDVRAPDRDVEHLLSLKTQPYWIALLTPQDTTEPQVRQLIATYFFDYHTLPTDPQRLLMALGHVYGMARMRRKLRNGNRQGSRAEEGIIGNSQPIKKLLHSIGKVAGSHVPVLIVGDTGTGKELAARAIHQRSTRARGPFVAVNCGALPASLIQAELFGHEKGAFTGAHHQRIGQFEAADSGTIFLDEIGDLSLQLQVNLLRVLEQRTIVRVGGTKQIPIDVRVIAATHKKLEESVARREFREDIYYRLNVVQLAVPDLKDRGPDIELLADYFLRRFTEEAGPHGPKRFSNDVLRMMYAHSWPGNVRELMNRVQRAVLMSECQTITTQDMGLECRSTDQRVFTLEEARSAAERNVVIAALKRARKNVTQAAQELGVSRATLYRIIEKYHIQT
jgi:DNA-binding NtrC family response regulator